MNVGCNADKKGATMNTNTKMNDREFNILSDLDSEIGERYFFDGNGIPEDYKSYPDVVYLYRFLERDVELALVKAFDIDEAAEYICGLFNASPLKDRLYSYISIEVCYDAAYIRRDWATALRASRNVFDISAKIGYGFSESDLKELAKLHKADMYQDEIEYLLTDCNYKKECSLMEAGDYSRWL